MAVRSLNEDNLTCDSEKDFIHVRVIGTNKRVNQQLNGLLGIEPGEDTFNIFCGECPVCFEWKSLILFDDFHSFCRVCSKKLKVCPCCRRDNNKQPNLRYSPDMLSYGALN